MFAVWFTATASARKRTLSQARYRNGSVICDSTSGKPPRCPKDCLIRRHRSGYEQVKAFAVFSSGRYRLVLVNQRDPLSVYRRRRRGRRQQRGRRRKKRKTQSSVVCSLARSLVVKMIVGRVLSRLACGHRRGTVDFSAGGANGWRVLQVRNLLSDEQIPMARA